MSRAELTLNGLKRANVPANRKLPLPLDDFRSLKGMLNLNEVDQLILCVTVLLGRFFLLRMIEFPVANSKFPPTWPAPVAHG